jgi:type IV pilus assembly protein PilW
MNIINLQSKKILRLKRQSGLSLIELMISMVVGLFLLAGVVTNFISTTDADIKRDAVSEMDANASAAFNTLRQTIQHAGYSSIENIRIDNPFYTENEAVTNVTCRNGSQRDLWSVPANRRTRDSDSKDFLTVISLADNPCTAGNASCPAGSGNENPDALVYTDCTGGGATRDARAVSCSTDLDVGMNDPTEAKIYSSFWLMKNSSSPEDRTLYCGGSRSEPQPLVNDVEAIQYLYGVTNDAGRTTYRRADQVEAGDQWGMVTSVQVGLLMRSSNQYVLDQVSTKTRYNLLNTNVDIAAKDLRRLFRIYTTTINLENKRTGALL